VDTVLLAALSGLAVGGAAVLADRLLGRAVAARLIERPEIRCRETIAAPLGRTWDLAADIARQPEWMHEMKRVEMLTPPPIGVGSRGRATVRIFGISTTDEVVITAFDPPVRFGIRHEGRFEGEGLLRFVAHDAATTVVDWMEYLRPPLLPHLGAFLQRPILRRIFAADLRRLRLLLESERD
jgi:uncharacterized membrane protein